MVVRGDQQVPLYARLLSRTTPPVFIMPAVVFEDEMFLAHLARTCGDPAFLGSSRYCPSSTFVSALLIFWCGVLH